MNEYDKKFIARINFLANEKCMFEAEELFEDYLKNNPNNIEMLLRFANFEFSPPIYNEEKSFEAIKKVLELDENNIEALLLWSIIEYFTYGDINHETFNKLEKIKTNSLEKLAMLELMKAWYYEIAKDYISFEKSLKKSIDLYPNFVDHYLKLSEYYISQNKFKLVKQLILKALDNVKQISVGGEFIDYTNYHETFDYYINGKIKSELQMKNIHKNLNELSKDN